VTGFTHERFGPFEQLVQTTFRQIQDDSNGALKYHSSPLKGDRRYYFLSGDDGSLEIACIVPTDDAMWTLTNRNWPDQLPTWNQFHGEERNESFLHLKVRELRVRLGLPWVDANSK
jgi:hypothetical protein